MTCPPERPDGIITTNRTKVLRYYYTQNTVTRAIRENFRKIRYIRSIPWVEIDSRYDNPLSSNPF